MEQPHLTLPLTESERGWLMQIYTTRYKDMFFKGYFRLMVRIMLIWIVLTFLSALLLDIVAWNGLSRFNTEYFGTGFSNGIVASLLGTPLYVAILYYAWMLPYKKDALSGIKQRAPFTVIKKEYYYVTGQYFVTLKERKDKRYEVDAAAYDQCEENGTIYLDQAIRTGYIFSLDNSAIVKMFHTESPARRRPS